MATSVKWGQVRLASICLLLMACTSPHQPSAAAETAGTNQEATMNSKDIRAAAGSAAGRPAADTERIAPGSCRMIGKVVSVMPELAKDKNSPCAQVPCKAVVQITKIVGYGSAFGQPLAAGAKINAYFTFTLSPTSRFFPELTQPLPGLRPGSIFQADVRPATESSNGQPADWYQIYTYILQ